MKKDKFDVFLANNFLYIKLFWRFTKTKLKNLSQKKAWLIEQIIVAMKSETFLFKWIVEDVKLISESRFFQTFFLVKIHVRQRNMTKFFFFVTYVYRRRPNNFIFFFVATLLSQQQKICALCPLCFWEKNWTLHLHLGLVTTEVNPFRIPNSYFNF